MDKTTRHHVPPRHPDKQPRFVRKKRQCHHNAYHILFGAAPTFEACVDILRKDWWENPDAPAESRR
jgi:hypothetical protein